MSDSLLFTRHDPRVYECTRTDPPAAPMKRTAQLTRATAAPPRSCPWKDGDAVGYHPCVERWDCALLGCAWEQREATAGSQDARPKGKRP